MEANVAQLQPERLTTAVEVDFFRRLAEAAVLGHVWDELAESAKGLRKQDRLYDDVTTALMDACPDLPAVEWARFLEHVADLLLCYRNLKLHHGPQVFRGMLRLVIEHSGIMRSVLDEAEREALGLVMLPTGGVQRVAS